MACGPNIYILHAANAHAHTHIIRTCVAVYMCVDVWVAWQACMWLPHTCNMSKILLAEESIIHAHTDLIFWVCMTFRNPSIIT